jgi:hypothetical protein
VDREKLFNAIIINNYLQLQLLVLKYIRFWFRRSWEIQKSRYHFGSASFCLFSIAAFLFIIKSMLFLLIATVHWLHLRVGLIALVFQGFEDIGTATVF